MIPTPFQVPSDFESAPRTFSVTLPSGGERVRMMPTPFGANRFQNDADHLIGSLSRLADR